MNSKKTILFQMTINIDGPDVEKHYTLFDSDPSFFTLSKNEKKAFLKKEEQKIKQLITNALQPRLQHQGAGTL